MRAVVNHAFAPAQVPSVNREAGAFHAALPGYRPTPVADLAGIARELGLASVLLKDESDRLGLPAFKVLGASWAVERALRDAPEAHTLVAASAGNHGRAVARLAAQRGLRCRILLPRGSSPARSEGIASEGADVEVIDGDYEDAVAQASAEAGGDGVVEIADVGEADTARWVIDGYATLFAEAASQAEFDLMLVPVGGGSLGAAAARFGAESGTDVVGVEPVTADCLTASLAAGEPTAVPTPGTTMAPLNCGEVSPSAWPSLVNGLRGSLTVTDAEVAQAQRDLAAVGLVIGESGAAPLAGLRALAGEAECAELREALSLGPEARVLLIGSEGPTDPDSYGRAVG